MKLTTLLILNKVDAQYIPNVSADNVVKNAINTALFVAGVVAVVMIIFASIQYLTASGDSAKSKKATQTIIYAIAGLIVVMLAYSIINFVLKSAVGE